MHLKPASNVRTAADEDGWIFRKKKEEAFNVFFSEFLITSGEQDDRERDREI